MNAFSKSFKVQLASAALIVSCIPLILVAGRYEIGEPLFRLIQMVGIMFCFLSGAVVLIRDRKGLHVGWLVFSGVAFVLSGLYLLIIGYILFGPGVENVRHRQKFDAEVWRQSADDSGMWPPRLCMADHLIRSGKLDGLTEAEVLALLGEPAKKGFPGAASQCDIHYYIGPERGFIRIDSEWLFIAFGNDGKENRYWLYRD